MYKQYNTNQLSLELNLAWDHVVRMKKMHVTIFLLHAFFQFIFMHFTFSHG